jgi:hypothetical protein
MIRMLSMKANAMVINDVTDMYDGVTLILCLDILHELKVTIKDSREVGVSNY